MAEDWKDGADAKWIVLKSDRGSSAKLSALNDRHGAAKMLVDCFSASGRTLPFGERHCRHSFGRNRRASWNTTKPQRLLVP
jgi:hypothetical protein